MFHPLTEWSLERQILLQRVATWMAAQLNRELDQLQRDILGELHGTDPGGTADWENKKQRLAEIAGILAALIGSRYVQYRQQVKDWFAEIADAQASLEVEKMNTLLGADFEPIKIDLSEMVILGATIDAWLEKQGTDLAFRTEAGIRGVIMTGGTTEEAAIKVKGSPTTPGTIPTSKRDAEVILRTGVDKVPTEVAVKIAQQHPEDTTFGWQQISILDNRTTQTCRDYAWNKWTIDFKPVDGALPFNGGPPRHANCRSHVVLIDLRNPNPLIEFSAWVKSKTNAEQDRLFGAKKARLWREGKLSDADLIRQHDRQMTVDEFKKAS